MKFATRLFFAVDQVEVATDGVAGFGVAEGAVDGRQDSDLNSADPVQIQLSSLCQGAAADKMASQDHAETSHQSRRQLPRPKLPSIVGMATKQFQLV